jgi:hypothetical protein
VLAIDHWFILAEESFISAKVQLKEKQIADPTLMHIIRVAKRRVESVCMT